MKHTLKAMVLAGVMAAGSLSVAPPAEAQRYRDSHVSVYVGTPGLSVGYSRGYYDRYHRWRRCDRWHRCYYPSRYYRHDRGHHYGWYRHHRQHDDWRYRDRYRDRDW